MNDLIQNNDDSRKMLKDYPDVLSFEQMCSVLSISPVTGYKLLKANKVTHIKIGRVYKIPKIHMLNYLKNDSH